MLERRRPNPRRKPPPPRRPKPSRSGRRAVSTPSSRTPPKNDPPIAKDATQPRLTGPTILKVGGFGMQPANSTPRFRCWSAAPMNSTPPVFFSVEGHGCSEDVSSLRAVAGPHHLRLLVGRRHSDVVADEESAAVGRLDERDAGLELIAVEAGAGDGQA